MRIATWNVNSLSARLERVLGWLVRAQPDVLLLQETKLADADAPHAAFAAAGYTLAHHGQGRWNGVAIASRVGIQDVRATFGEALVARDNGEADAEDHEPQREARIIAATCSGVRVVSVYVPNGRTVDSVFYKAKLAWLARLGHHIDETSSATSPLVVGGDFNVAPTDDDVWDPTACVGGTHVSAPERMAIAELERWGLLDAYRAQHPERGRYSWWDYRAGAFHKNFGMRIDLMLVTAPVATRVVWAEIDREARKGKPTPSDHAPVLIDLDTPGHPLDAGWSGAEERIARRGGKPE